MHQMDYIQSPRSHAVIKEAGRQQEIAELRLNVLPPSEGVSRIGSDCHDVRLDRCSVGSLGPWKLREEHLSRHSCVEQRQYSQSDA